MKNHVPYNERRLDHQEPVHAVSQWQCWNDLSEGWEAQETERERQQRFNLQRARRHMLNQTEVQKFSAAVKLRAMLNRTPLPTNDQDL